MYSKHCTGCGAEVPEGASFCATCGAPVKAEASTATIPSGYCSACGAALPAGASFCGSCGVELRGETTAPGPAAVGAAPGKGYSEWPMWRQNPARTGGDGSVVYPPLEELWRFKAEGNIVDSIAVAGDLVCFGTEDNKLYGIDASSGRERWIVTLQEPPGGGRAVVGAPAIADGQVFFCCDLKTVRALDADSGQERWCHEMKNRPMHAPAVDNGRVFVTDKSSMLHCLNADNGELLWSTKMERNAYTAPIYEDGAVWADGGNVYRFDATNGSAMETSKALGRLAFVSTSAGICGWNRAWLGVDDDRRFLRIEHDNINLRTWQLKGEPVLAATADDLQTYILRRRYTVDTMPHPAVEADGWTAFVGEDFPLPPSEVPKQAFALAGPVLYVANHDGVLFAIWTDPSVMMKRWSVKLPSRPASISIGAGRLFVSDDQGGVSAFKGGTREAAQRLLTPRDTVHSFPSLVAKVILTKGLYHGEKVLRGATQVLIRNAAKRGKYQGFVEPYTQIDGFGSLTDGVAWPEGCCLCGEPAVKSHTILSTWVGVHAPYCGSCHQRVRSGQETSAVLGETLFGVLNTLSFRNERYWAQFMRENELK